MKNYFTTIILILFSAIILPSCSDSQPANGPNGNNNTLPDAIFTGSVSGDYNEQINITIPGNYLNNGNSRIDGGYVAPPIGLMILTATVSPNLFVTLNSYTNGIDTGSFVMSQGQGDSSSYSNFGIGASGFKSVSGTLIITKKEYLQTIGNDYDWYLDGSYSMSMVNRDAPPKQVNISGTFKAIHVSDN